MAPVPHRRNEILSLFVRYGILDINAIDAILKGEIGKKRIHKVLQDLVGKGFVRCGTIKLGGTPSHYWCLAQDEETQKRALAITGQDSRECRTKSCHWSQYPHEALCSYFQASILRQMPSVHVLREASRAFKELPEHLISEEFAEMGYLPDMCLGIPSLVGKEGEEKTVLKWVAVEIDRSARSKKRLISRTNIYSSHTAFSGLLYLTPDENEAKKLGAIYEDGGAKSSLRIKGANESFLALGTVPKGLIDVRERVLNCGGKSLSICEWLSLTALRSTRSRDAGLLSI